MNPSTTSSVASLGNIGRRAVSPLHRSFTSIQMVHTHTQKKKNTNTNTQTQTRLDFVSLACPSLRAPRWASRIGNENLWSKCQSWNFATIPAESDENKKNANTALKPTATMNHPRMEYFSWAIARASHPKKQLAPEMQISINRSCHPNMLQHHCKS